MGKIGLEPIVKTGLEPLLGQSDIEMVLRRRITELQRELTQERIKRKRAERKLLQIGYLAENGTLADRVSKVEQAVENMTEMITGMLTRDDDEKDGGLPPGPVNVEEIVGYPSETIRILPGSTAAASEEP